MPRELLLSLHDVAPVHHERVARAEALFAELGVRKITYLLVPNFHGRGESHRSEEFVRWCHAERPFALEWFLHGYYHQEREEERQPGARLAARLQRRWMTAGEGEFLALDVEEIRRRIRCGAGVFRACTGAEPEGFVAPAWLFHPQLPRVLREERFRFHEDHRRVYGVQSGRTLPAPVITWATRTPLRKWTSVLGCPVLLRLWRRAAVLRLAVHPHDFDHEETVRSIRAVWSAALAERTQRSYAEVVA